MNWTLVVVGVAVSAGISVGQTAAAPAQTVHHTAPAQSAAGQDAGQIPAGTIIAAELTKSADAKKLKVGEALEARIAADVLVHGKILIARNTKMIGHVTEVKGHSKESPDSKLGVTFDRVVTKDRHELPVRAVIQAVGRPLRSAALAGPDPMDVSTGMSIDRIPAAGGAMSGSAASRSPASSRPSDTSNGSSPAATPESTVAPLGPTSQGAVGMKKFSLSATGHVSVISSRTDNVHLDSGTQLILRTQ